MQEQEDSEEGETPADPSAGKWLPVAPIFQHGALQSRVDPGQTDMLTSCVQEGDLSTGARVCLVPP